MSGTATTAGRVLTRAGLGFLVLAAFAVAGESPAAPSGGIGAASQPTRVLTVFVTDERTGKPLADVNVESSWLTASAAAQIRAQPRSGQPGCDVFPRVVVEAKTNADGQATLQIPAEDLENGTVLMTRTGYAAARASWGIVFGKKSPINPTRVEAALIPAVAIGGIVKNEEGAPVLGVTLQINRSFEFQQERPVNGQTSYRILAQVTTDEQGRWRFEGMGDRKPRSSELQINVQHPEYSTEFEASHVTDPPWDELLAKTWVFTIKKDRRPRATLTGRIVDLGGKPLEGARIWTGDSTFGVSLGPQAQIRVKSDADGRFVMADVLPHEPPIITGDEPPPSHAILNIAAAGHFWKSVEWDVRKGSREETFQLSPAPPLRVQVVDGAGTPIADVDMGSPRVATGSLLSVDGKSGGDGAFVYVSYPDADFTVRLTKDGYQPREFTRSELAAGKLTLSGEMRIRGVVVDAATGRPIDRFRIGLQREQPNRGFITTIPQSLEDGRAGRFELSDASVATHYRVMVEAEGYRTHGSDRLGAEQLQQELRIALQPALAVMRKILTPDGAPAAGASCSVMSSKRDQHDRQTFIDGKAERSKHSGPFGDHIDITASVADADGNAKLQWKKEKDSAFVYHESGWAYLQGASLNSSEPIPLQRWGSVKGLLREGGKPVPNAALIVRSTAKSDGRLAFVSASQTYAAVTDAEGRFSVARVLPEHGSVGPAAPAEFHWWQPRFEQSFTLEPGATAQVDLVADGPTIIARLPVRGESSRTIEGDAIRPYGSLQRVPPAIPTDVREKGGGAIEAWHDAWRASAEGKFWLSLPHTYTADVRDDRTIRFEHVAPGEYSLNCMLWDENRAYNFVTKISVAETVNADQVIDLGLIEPLKPELALKPGMPAPDLTAKTADGADFQLSTLRGKFIVIDFWATWCGPCRAAMPELKRIHAEFAKDERVEFLGLSFDDSLSDWKRYVKEESLPGTQLISKGFAENPLSKAWGVRGIPAVFVIDPSGRILAANTTPAGAEGALRAALPKTPPR